MGGLIMLGTINCNKCGGIINDKTYKCDKCGRVTCHITIKHGRPKPWRYYKDKQTNGTYTYLSARDALIKINFEIKERTFQPQQWTPEAVDASKLHTAAIVWLENIRDSVDKNELAHSTYCAYQSYFNTHILNEEYGIGHYDLAEIDYNELEKFLKRLPRHLKIKTRKEIMMTLKTFLKWTCVKGYMKTLPFFPRIKGDDSKDMVALTCDQQTDAFKKIPEQHREIFLVSTGIGTRPGESCMLKKKDVDVEKAEIKIQRTLSKGKVREQDKENHKWSVPIPLDAFEIIARRMKNIFPDDFLFVDPDNGKPYTTGKLRKLWKKTGFPVTHYEATRHSYATQICEVSEDIHAVRDLLRHSTLQSTMKYVHRTGNYLRDIQEKRGQVINLADAKKESGK